MTDLDLDAIRRIYNHPGGSAIVFVLGDEVERLRVARTALYSKVLALRDEDERLRSERDALRVDNDRLRRDVAMGVDEANRMLLDSLRRKSDLSYEPCSC